MLGTVLLINGYKFKAFAALSTNKGEKLCKPPREESGVLTNLIFIWLYSILWFPEASLDITKAISGRLEGLFPPGFQHLTGDGSGGPTLRGLAAS